MHGNFEVDRGSYPFTAMNIGDSVKVVYTPSLQVLVDVALPRPLASNVALRINTQYHASKAGGNPFDGTSARVRQIIREEAVAAYRRKELIGTEHDRIILRLGEQEA